MARDIEADEEDTLAPQGDGRGKLKLILHYAMLGFAPVVSVLALAVALFAGNNHADSAQITELNSRIERLNANLSAAREELENLKFIMSRDKSQRADERKAEEEHDAKIVQSISRLQEKLKVAPTLEEQLRVVAGKEASAGATATPVVAPMAGDKIQAASAPVPASVEKKAAAAVPAPAVDEKKKATVSSPAKKIDEKKAAPAPKAAEKMSPQVKALKDAIDQYNKQ